MVLAINFATVAKLFAGLTHSRLKTAIVKSANMKDVLYAVISAGKKISIWYMTTSSYLLMFQYGENLRWLLRMRESFLHNSNRLGRSDRGRNTPPTFRTHPQLEKIQVKLGHFIVLCWVYIVDFRL